MTVEISDAAADVEMYASMIDYAARGGDIQEVRERMVDLQSAMHRLEDALYADSKTVDEVDA